MGRLATAEDYRRQSAVRIEELGYRDPDGNVAAAIALVWRNQENPARFDLDAAITQVFAPPTGEFAKPGRAAIPPAELTVGDMLTDGGVVVSGPVTHPTGAVVAEVDYRVRRRWPSDSTVEIHRG